MRSELSTSVSWCWSTRRAASSRPRCSSPSASRVTRTLTIAMATPMETTARAALAKKIRFVREEKIGRFTLLTDVTRLVGTRRGFCYGNLYIDGAKVVENGRVLTIDYPAAAAALHEAQARVKAKVPSLDWGGRSAAAISPLTFPER